MENEEILPSVLYNQKNHSEELNHIFIMANNAKAACRKCKEIVCEKTGQNPFRPTTNVENLIK